MPDSDLPSGYAIAAKPANQVMRLDALRSYRVLDTPPEAAFDDLTRLASIICETPMSLISLLDDRRQWFKSALGISERELEIDSSLCSHAILEPVGIEITDTHADSRFRSNPLVIGAPHLRFYAGVVLRTPSGLALGTMCVLDTKPKQLTAVQREALASIARQAMAQLELRKTLSDASLAMRYRAQLMAVAGHDLKQPLQVLSMSLATLRRPMADEDRSSVVTRAERALVRLDTELSGLAQASRLDQDDTIELEDFPLSRILSELHETWRLHAEAKGIQLHFAKSRMWIRSNPVMLWSILGNLVGNAIKYTDRGAVLVGCRRRGAGIEIQVHDSGRGIPEDERSKIFEPFMQLDATAEGLGLGLSIVKQYSDFLHHDLAVASRVGVGSVFSVTVPLAERP